MEPLSKGQLEKGGAKRGVDLGQQFVYSEIGRGIFEREKSGFNTGVMGLCTHK